MDGHVGNRIWFKESVSRDFWLLFFFHDSNPSGPLINRVKNFRIRFRFHVKPLFILLISSFMIELFTPKRISPDWPFKSNQRLTLQCSVWLRCVMHTTEQYDAHRGAWLRGGMHTAEFLKNLNIDTEFENTLPCLSGAKMGLNHGKNRD